MQKNKSMEKGEEPSGEIDFGRQGDNFVPNQSLESQMVSIFKDTPFHSIHILFKVLRLLRI